MKHAWSLDLDGISCSYGNGIGIYAVRNRKLYTIEEYELRVTDIVTGKRTKSLNNALYAPGIGGIIDDVLFVDVILPNNNYELRALDIATLKPRWTFEYDRSNRTYIVNGSDGKVFHKTENKELNCFDIDTGEILWTLPEPDSSTVYISGDKFVHAVDKTLFCRNLDDFDLVWSLDTTIPDIRFIGMIAKEDALYIPTFYYYDLPDDKAESFGGVFAVDINDGSILWSDREKTRMLTVTSVSVNDKYVFMSLNFEIICFGRFTGERLWIHSDETDYRIGQTVCTEKYVYYCSRHSINCLYVHSGKVVSTIETDFDFGSSARLFMADRKLFTGSLYCFKAFSEVFYKLGSKQYIINGNVVETDSEPVIINNRTLLSVRYVIEPLDGSIEWNPKERKVTCALLAPRNQTDDYTKENVVELWIDKPEAMVNGERTYIDPENHSVMPLIIGGRTMILMRFLAESLGCDVLWNDKDKSITLTYEP